MASVICNQPDFSATYGGGIVLHISDNSNINKKSYSIKGDSYGASEEMSARSLTKNTYFTVKEIEVYHVQIFGPFF